MQNDIVKTGKILVFFLSASTTSFGGSRREDALFVIPYFAFLIYNFAFNLILSSFFGIVHSTNPPYLCTSLKGYLSVIICFSFAFHKLSVIDNLMGRQS